MKKIISLIVIASFALAIGACARKAPDADPPPPPRKAFDAKTQLESGRTR